MKKKAIIISLIAVLLIFIIIGLIVYFVLFSGNNLNPLESEYDIAFDDIAVKPISSVENSITNVDKSKILKLSNEMTDDKDVLMTISYLYNLANQNLMDLDYYASIAYSLSTIVIGSKDSGYTYSREYIVNDGDQYFYQAYTFAPEVTGFVKDLAESAEERYSNDKGQTFYKRHGGSAAISPTCLDDFLSTTKSPIIYENMATAGQKHAPKIYSQKEFYEFRHVRIAYDEIDNALIYAGYKDGEWYSTLVDGSVKYDKARGCYIIEFNVDISESSEALENGRKNLSAAGGMKVGYKKQHQTITIWECGLFCYYHTDNHWASSIYGSKNDFHKYFTYNKDNVQKLVIPSDLSWIENCKKGEKD